MPIHSGYFAFSLKSFHVLAAACFMVLRDACFFFVCFVPIFDFSSLQRIGKFDSNVPKVVVRFDGMYMALPLRSMMLRRQQQRWSSGALFLKAK